jgi:hypothetical protein
MARGEKSTGGEGTASGRFAFSNPTEGIKIPYDPTLSQCSRSQDLATILDTIVTDCMALCREQCPVWVPPDISIVCPII